MTARTAPAGSSGAAAASAETDTPYAWLRLGVAVLLSMLGNVGMWSVVVALPAVQAEFGAARSGASLPYTLTMLGFGAGGVMMGRFADRYGIVRPVVAGTVLLSVGYVLAGLSGTLWQYALVHGVLIGLLGCSATFAPLIADTSLWFRRRRGIAVALCACGNYLAGAAWPPVVQHMVSTYGWRPTHVGIGLFCLATMLPLSLMLRRPSPSSDAAALAASPQRVEGAAAPQDGRGGGAGLLSSLGPGGLQALLVVAGIACCVAMAMPQVHLVAYCSDLGYGPARGAQMLSLMLLCGIVSRVGSGLLADRIGGLPTLLLGSVLQGMALLLYLGFDGMASLYVISALFGLFQGGIIPSYAIVVRELYPAREAGTRVGLVLMATLGGMALGGWMSGAIFDLTGSYQAAFVNGVLWNALNVAVVLFLLLRQGRGQGRGQRRGQGEDLGQRPMATPA